MFIIINKKNIIPISIVSILFLTLFFNNQPTSASTNFLNSLSLSNLTKNEETIFSQNDLIFVEPCGSSSIISGEIKISGESAEEKVWSGLRSFLSIEQAAGIMGNIGQEDGNYNPVRREVGQSGDLYDKSKQIGIGLIQWSFGRRVNLLNFIKEQDSDLLQYFEDDSNAQITGDEFITKVGVNNANKIYQLEIQFLKNEIDRSYKEYYKQTDIDAATIWFREKVERAGVYSDSFRTQKAHEAYDKYQNTSFFNSEIPSCNSCEQDSLNINGAAVCLAWPKGTNESKYSLQINPNAEATQSFTSALQTVFPDSKNSGDINVQRGSSCDVFVGTVVRYSGYDKDFPMTGPSVQLKYAKEHTSLWDVISFNNTKEELQAGDIVVEEGKHIQIISEDSEGNLHRVQASYGEEFSVVKNSWSIPIGDYIIRAKNAQNSNTGISVTNGVTSSDDGGANATVNNRSCNRCSNSGGALKDGGYTSTAEAEEAIMKKYKSLNNAEAESKYHINVGCDGILIKNCPSFVKYFINEYTNKTWTGATGNGSQTAKIVAETYNLPSGKQPQPYAVFSTASGATMCGSTKCGHTGIVLGVDSANDKIIIGEAGCSASLEWIGAHEYSLSEYTNGSYTYTYLDSILKTGGSLNNG